MGDPFADLLMRFKGDESGSQMKMKDEGLLNGQDPKDFGKSSSADVSQPNVEESSNSSKIDDDLEKLFNITSNTNAIHGEGKEDLTLKQNQSDLDPFFDPLQTTPEKPTQEVESGPTQAVDEARDREIAKLMSLGYSIHDANASYDNGVLYDDLMREAKEKKLRMRRLQRQMAEAKWENENPVSTVENNNGGERDIGLFSIASNILNKGKELADQFSLFSEEKYNNTLQSSSTGKLEQKRFAKPDLPRRPQEDYDLISGIQDELLGNDIKREYSPPANQGRRGSLLVARTDESATFNPPQLNETLLDFDESPGSSSSSILIAATKQESQSPTFVVPITDIELSGYEEFKTRAGELFKTGDYVTAVQEYEKTLNTLPQRHPLRIISYSNLMASQLKTGQYKESIGAASAALGLFPEDTSRWSQIIQNSEPARTYSDMWIKIVLRQAEAFEHLENFSGALKAYQSLVEKNFCTYKVMEGRRRCQKVLSPERYKVVRKPVDVENPPPSSNLSSKEYGNLRNVKENNRKQAEEESQRHALYDKVYEQIKEWESDRANDIRHLLSNLQEIIPWVNWKPVSSAELVMPKKVKGTYMRAATKTHPDKVPDSLALEKKMIIENVFSRLSSAWEKFKTENDIR